MYNKTAVPGVNFGIGDIASLILNFLDVSVRGPSSVTKLE